MNDLEALAVIFETVSRGIPKERPKLVVQVWPFIEALFVAERLFQEDKSRRKAAVCSGRAGKSTTAAACLMEACGNVPAANGVYVAPTRGMAKRILWKELKRLNEVWSLGIDFNETELTATLRNGSQIHLVGANNADQIDKLRGMPIVLAVIDEAGMIGSYLKELVEEVISPRLMDFDGSLMLIGTPTAACAGYFYDVTRNDDREQRLPGWSVHEWTVLDNPYVPLYPSPALKEYAKKNEKALKENYPGATNPLAAAWVERERTEKGWEMHHPGFQREYLGRWVRSAEHLVFHEFGARRNLIPALPKKEFEFGLGVDLGWKDGVGIVEVAFQQPSRDQGAGHLTAYASRAWRHDEMIVASLAKEIQRIEKERGGLAFVVIDQSGAGKMIAEELRQRYGINCKGAEKTKKPTFLRLLNSDLRLGRLKIVGTSPRLGQYAGPCMDLLEEVPLLLWDEEHLKKGRYIEDSRVKNDVSDGFIYAYRECRHYLYDGEAEDGEGNPPEMAPEEGTPEAEDREARIHHRERGRARKAQQERDWWESS